MIGAGQLAAALTGLRLLLRLDPRGLELFEKTAGGFARSFIVAAMLLPLHALHWVLSFDAAKENLDLLPYLVVKALTYVLLWVLFPFVMLYVTELLERRPRYYWHIVAYNWLQLPLGLLMMPIAFMADGQLLPQSILGVLNLGALAAFFFYATFLARWGLMLAPAMAFGVVVLDFVLGEVVNGLVGKI